MTAPKLPGADQDVRLWHRGFAVDVGTVRLLDAEPALADELDERRRALARQQLLVETLSYVPGGWRPAGAARPLRGGVGLLILEGVVAVRTAIGTRHSVELVGEGDVMRPTEPDEEHMALVGQQVAVKALTSVRLASLDHEFVSACASFPELLAALLRPSAWRVRSLRLRLALAQIPSLERRIELLLWHLADRWGRRAPAGIVLPLPLSQQLVAELACAQRSSVGAALRALGGSGRVDSTERGRWMLVGDPPSPTSD